MSPVWVPSPEVEGLRGLAQAMDDLAATEAAAAA